MTDDLRQWAERFLDAYRHDRGPKVPVKLGFTGITLRPMLSRA